MTHHLKYKIYFVFKLKKNTIFMKLNINKLYAVARTK